MQKKKKDRERERKKKQHFFSKIIKHSPEHGSENISRNKQQRDYDKYGGFLQEAVLTNNIYR